MKELNLSEIFHIHFIGIGGIGVSAIARMMLGESKEVSGSDRASSLVTDELSKLGAKIYFSQTAKNISSDIDLVVYTIAIPDDNPELAEARKRGIKCLTYPEMLGFISAKKFTIAVAGTHGKTTTTAMIAEIMLEAKLDPTVIVGSLLKRTDGGSNCSNFIAGQSQYLVVEACEYRRSFLNINPKIIVITNIDNDHLDYYKDLKDIQLAFIEFVAKLPADGVLICNTDDPRLSLIIESLKNTSVKIIDYKKLKDKKAGLKLSIPGEHNIDNALSALAVGESLRVGSLVAIEALNKFNGTWRRFDFKGKTKKGSLVYDDYAHHPTEIIASLTGAREFMKKNNLTGRLLIAFQPHLFSRTKLLKTELANSLSLADEIILAPIYASREKNDLEINSNIIADLIKVKNKPVFSLNNLEQIVSHLEQYSKPEDFIMTIGAGDIFKVGDDLVELKG